MAEEASCAGAGSIRSLFPFVEHLADKIKIRLHDLAMVCAGGGDTSRSIVSKPPIHRSYTTAWNFLQANGLC
jgi:hypothetical protein